MLKKEINMTIRFYKHTADLKYIVSEKTFKKLLENSAKAMFNVIAKEKLLKEKKQFKVKIRVKKNDELIVRLLSELLALHQSKEFFFKTFKVLKTDEKTFIDGIVKGEVMTPEKGRIDVKAVTFHEFKFTKNKKGYSTTIILDI